VGTHCSEFLLVCFGKLANVTHWPEAYLTFDVPTFQVSFAHPDAKQVNFVNPTLNALQSEKSVSVEPFIDKLFGK